MDKTVSVAAAAKMIRESGDVFFGGSALSRKPLWMVRELLHDGARDLHLGVAIGGLDVDILIAGAALESLTFAYVGLEALGLAPWFRAARQQNTIGFVEWSEQTLIAALSAAVERLPFYPTRSGLGSDLLTLHPEWQIFSAPYSGEPLVAVPALAPGAVVLHVNVACSDGSAVIMGDLHTDPLLARAARQTIVGAERVLNPADFARFLEESGQAPTILGLDVDAVVHAPQGAWPGLCFPDYGADIETLQRYLACSRDGDREGALECIGGERR